MISATIRLKQIDVEKSNSKSTKYHKRDDESEMILMKKDFDIAMEFAQNEGFERITMCGHWKGYTVFAAVFCETQPNLVAGCDELILVQNGDARWTDDDECDEIYDALMFD